MIFLIVGIIVVFAMLAIAAGVRGDLSGPRRREDITRALRPVDLQSLNNLLDPQQDEFLRATLSRPEFRRLQRIRKRAALDYVSAIAYNAALVIRWSGIAGEQGADPTLAQAARDIVDTALAVRLHAIAALCLLGIGTVFPNFDRKASVPVEAYNRLKTLLFASRQLAPSRLAQIATSL